MAMQAKELMMGLQLQGAYIQGGRMAGDKFWQTYLETSRMIPPEITEATLRKIRAMGEIIMLTPEQVDSSISFVSRGIGTENVSCFDCGHESRNQPNIAAFVQTKYDGERAVAMFQGLGSTANLDYRDHEPNWIQVKVGACQDHRLNLEKLDALTQANGRHLHPALIESARTLTTPVDLDQLDKQTEGQWGF